MSGLLTAPMRSLLDERHKAKLPGGDSEIWCLNLDQIESHSGKVLSKLMLKRSEVGPSTYAFNQGTVLYSKLRPYLNKVVVADGDGVATTELVPLRCDESKVAPSYLAHFLRSATFLAFATNVVAGAKMPRMVMGEFWSYPVPLPPVSEQRRIAAILDQAETLRTQRRAALAQLDSLTQSIFLDMFGDPLDDPKRWTWLRMSELFETSPIFGTMIPGDAGSGSWLCLRVANIQDWQLTLEDKKYVDLPESAITRHSVKAGDLLMARAIASQDHLGKCIVAQPGDEQWAFDSHLMRLRFRTDRALPDFVRCQVPCDYVPRRSWPLLRARELMHGVIASFKHKEPNP